MVQYESRVSTLSFQLSPALVLNGSDDCLFSLQEGKRDMLRRSGSGYLNLWLTCARPWPRCHHTHNTHWERRNDVPMEH